MPIYNAALTYIDPSETKRYAGLGKVDFDEKSVKKACLEAQLLSTAKGIWQIYDYQACSGRIEINPPIYIIGKKIRNHLRLAEKIIILSVTIGELIEETITKYFQAGAYSYALLLDAAATTAVETTADEMEKTITQYITPKGYQKVMRFSPGYGDWDIRFQPEMLTLAKAEQIGVSLTESCMLIPRKSITAVIGLIPNQNLEQKNETHDCTICNKLDCLARKEQNK